MNKFLLSVLLMGSYSIPSCGQERWSSSLVSNKVPGGSVLSLRYETPNDSGEVHVAFVSLDSTLCYGGYRGKNNFPPEKDFDIQVEWGRCGTTTITDSTTVIYRGADKIILHGNRQEQTENGNVFLVAYKNSGESTLRRIVGNADLEILPPASQSELRVFLRDSLIWTEAFDR